MLITTLLFRAAIWGPVLVIIAVPDQFWYLIWGQQLLFLCRSIHCWYDSGSFTRVGKFSLGYVGNKRTTFSRSEMRYYEQAVFTTVLCNSQMLSVYCCLSPAFLWLVSWSRMFQQSLDQTVSHQRARDRAKRHKSCSFAKLPHELWGPDNVDSFREVKWSERRAGH